MKHALDTRIAEEHGVNIALLLENFQFWTLKNLQRNKHIHDGLCWTYDTLDALGQAFSYWTRRQIEHTINNAIKAGLLVKGNYNQTSYDRTCWYALTPKAYVYYPDLLAEKHLKSLWLSISQNCEIDFANFVNGFPKIVTTIPDTNPYTDPDIKEKYKKEKMGYTVSDERNGENEKSGYYNNLERPHLAVAQPNDTKGHSEKSDYFDNQT